MAAAKTLILGGSGFVGLNIAEALLARGRPVRLFDRTEPPHEAKEAFGRLPGACETVVGDVTDPGSLDAAVLADIDAIVLGATITADAERDRREPSRVLQVNVLGQIPVLERARTAGIRRIVNLSSGAAYGRTGMRLKLLEETSEADPEGLYALSKFASERVVARMGSLWGLDTVSVRLSGVFGPWERATGVRDTLSPHHQVVSIAKAGGTALLDRPALRDWIYAPDVAEAVIGLIDASSLQHSLYNVSSPTVWSVLDWSQHLKTLHPDFACRLAGVDERPNVDLYGTRDRAAMATARLRDETGWTARFGLAESASHYVAWRGRTDPGEGL